MSKESEMIHNFMKEKEIALSPFDENFDDDVCDEIADKNKIIFVSSPESKEQSTFGEEEIREYIYNYTQKFQ